MSEAEDIAKILKDAGYEVVLDPQFPPPSVPITEAVKDAPKHWP